MSYILDKKKGPEGPLNWVFEKEDQLTSCQTREIDKPIKPRAFLRRQVLYHFIKVTPEDLATLRAQIIATDAVAVRELAPIVRRMVDERAMCAFGNREILESSKAGLDVIELI